MKILHTVLNYICWCGIEKNEYNALKKDAYISNFRVWRVLHFLMTALFGTLFIASMFSYLMAMNRIFYLGAFIYSAAALCLFLALKEDSLVAQLLIYLSISLLFVFGALITQNKPELPATAFIVLLLITPMFMIDKPYFMAVELCVASAVFLVWMRSVKPYDVWRYDVINVVIYTAIGIFLHIIANSIRIKEFVLTRKINIQKDTDEMTGLKNKASLTRAINEFLAGDSSRKGVMFLLDVDRFKSINDTYGHDVGDQVIRQLGSFLGSRFSGDEIVGRFGGDEFVVFMRNTGGPEAARRTADAIVRGVSETVVLPDEGRKVSVSVGVAVCSGDENNYSDIFRKADIAMYKAKSDPENRVCIFG